MLQGPPGTAISDVTMQRFGQTRGDEWNVQNICCSILEKTGCEKLQRTSTMKVETRPWSHVCCNRFW